MNTENHHGSGPTIDKAFRENYCLHGYPVIHTIAFSIAWHKEGPFEQGFTDNFTRCGPVVPASFRNLISRPKYLGKFDLFRNYSSARFQPKAVISKRKIARNLEANTSPTSPTGSYHHTRSH